MTGDLGCRAVSLKGFICLIRIRNLTEMELSNATAPSGGRYTAINIAVLPANILSHYRKGGPLRNTMRCRSLLAEHMRAKMKDCGAGTPRDRSQGMQGRQNPSQFRILNILVGL